VSVEIVTGAKGPARITSLRRPEGLEIRVAGAEGVALLVLSGELDVSSTARLGDRFGELAAEVHSDVFVDVSGLTYIDSSGLASLVKAHRAFAAQGVRLVIVFPTAHVQRLFDICGLTSLLVVDPSDASQSKSA
jgi:anti-sigma B factor antagonist